MKRTRFCYLVLLLALTACQSQPQRDAAMDSTTKSALVAQAKDEAAIKEVIQRELAAARSNNADAVMGVLAPDATVKPPNEPPATGETLKTWSQAMFTNVAINQITYFDEQITLLGLVAVHTYGFDWTVTPKGGKAMQEKGHGIHILQRQADGSWRIKYDTWSADAPPPGGGGD